MNNNIEMAISAILGAFLFMALLFITLFTAYKLIIFIWNKKRKKRAYLLIVDGFKAITVDNNGIPVILEKNGNFELN
ncbi:hypothetical protein [Lebetimonas sp. JS138]|uniref:hypothetical protein n=1 Tax=Lebetimonas sp. JS138 TaxID=990072 RepID=UPI000467D69A|nr:hypothetical protein [Lebetimonas sp. JS138]